MPGHLSFLKYNSSAPNSASHAVPFLFSGEIEIVQHIKPNELSAAVLKTSADLAALDDWRTSCMIRLFAKKSKILA